jgi:cytochrome c551/c552
VTCVACHDASGLDVGPVEGEDVWITFRTTELLGRANTEPYQSHALQRSVMCDRCHYPDNAWGLTALVETPEP